MSGLLVRLIPGMIAVVVGTVLAIGQTGAAIEADLTQRATAVLDAPARAWAEIGVNGRELVLDGIATDRDEVAKAAAALATVPGSAGVETRVAIAEPISPYPFRASVTGGQLVLDGAFPSRALKAEWAALAPAAKDETTLHSGAPKEFGDATRFALQAALLLDEGKVSLSDTMFSLSGRARDDKALAALSQLATAKPATVTVAGLDVLPPLASPYVLTANFDGKTLTIDGNAPDARLADALRAVVPSGVTAKITLRPASGAPDDYTVRVTSLMKTLLTLESGELALSDGEVTLSGAPGSVAIAQAADSTVLDFGGKAKLDPPRIDAYGFVVAKVDGKLTFTGFVPDEASRTAFANAANADVSGLSLGRGAPGGFADVSALGLAVLDKLTDGRFTLDGSKVSVEGRTRALDDFRAAQAALAKPLPSGLSYAETSIHPPLVKPFTWSATRNGDGTVAMTGFVPSDTDAAALWNEIPKKGNDGLQPADGAPADFVASARKGLGILAMLDSGTLAYDGTAWSLSGNVDTARKGKAAETAFMLADLKAAGWTYDVKLPALPTIAPYVLRAQRGSDGTVGVTGYLPDDASKDALGALAANVKDATVLGAGAPPDFADAFAAGLTALMQLDQGALSLTGEKWTLTGDISDAAKRDSVQAALMAKVAPGNWQIAIQAHDAAPIVTPYLWSATKGTDGTVVLAGYVPSEDVKNIVTAEAGPVGGSTLAIASGEPAGFTSDALAGLKALSHLSRGRAAFDGRSWTLTGGVDSQADGEAALAALQQGSAGGKLWTPTLTGYVPQQFAAPSSSSSSVEPSSSSAEPVSSSSAAPSSSSSAEEAVSSEMSAASEMASSSSSAMEEAASEQPSDVSSEAVSASSSEMSSVSSEAPVSSSVASSSELSSSSAEPVPETVGPLPTVTPLPEKLVFSGTKAASGGIVLAGATPGKDVAAALVKIPGVRGGKLGTSDSLPADFAATATAGLTALADLEDGQMGFDGTGWWLHGRAASSAVSDSAKAAISALPQGGQWNVEIAVLNAFDVCRVRAAAVSDRNDIAFKAGKRDLSPESLAVLDELAADLAGCPEAIIHVQAHTDGDGDARQNLVLSVARAEMVVAELVKRGIAEDRLYAEGYGESAPVTDNDSKANKAKNRRVVFEITKN